MATVGLFEAKTHLSALVERAKNGEEIVITQRRRPVARLVAVEGPTLDRAALLEDLLELRRNFQARGISATPEEIKSWIDEGRR
jgi:prevent-host-death family protein